MERAGEIMNKQRQLDDFDFDSMMFGRDGKLYSIAYSIINGRLRTVSFFDHEGPNQYSAEMWFFHNDKRFRHYAGTVEEVR
jgi:hypothetical protein